MRQTRIDPRTGDLDGTEINHLGNALYLRLMTRRGDYWADREFGSKLYLIPREKDLPKAARLADQYAREAVQPLLDDGRARTIDVTVERQRGRLALLVEAVDASGNRAEFSHYVQVG